MSDQARERILAAVRRSLGTRSRASGAHADLEGRLASPPRGELPARGAVDHDARLALFEEMALEVSATVVRLPNMTAVPKAIADYLKEHNIPPKLKLAPDPLLDEPDWTAEPLLETERGKADPQDEVSVTAASAGVAETGTLVLTSGPGGPTTLNFLPDNNIVILRAGKVKGNYEDVWDLLRETQGAGQLPRTVNFITGPSRTGDIEQTIQLGAHGPRRLHILLITDSLDGAP